MKNRWIPILLAVALLGPALSARADSYFHFTRGGYLRAELLEDDGTAIRVRATGTGEVRVLQRSELTPRTRYKLELGRVAKDDAPGQLALADFALEHGLFSHAKKHYRAAARADDRLEPLMEAGLGRVRTASADALLAEARSRLAKMDERGARRRLSEVLSDFPDERAAEEAARLLEELAPVRMAAEEASSDPRVTRAVRDAGERYDRAAERNRSGLLASRSTSRALREFRGAEADLGKALEELESARRRKELSTADVEVLNAAEAELVDLYVDVAINTASFHMVQQSYLRALGAVNGALALSPRNQRLLSMRERIEDAAAEGDVAIPIGN